MSALSSMLVQRDDPLELALRWWDAHAVKVLAVLDAFIWARVVLA